MYEVRDGGDSLLVCQIRRRSEFLYNTQGMNPTQGQGSQGGLTEVMLPLSQCQEVNLRTHTCLARVPPLCYVSSNTNVFKYLFFIYSLLCAYVYMSMEENHTVYMWMWKDSFQESVLSFHYVGSGNRTHAVRFGFKHLNSLSLDSNINIFLRYKSNIYLLLALNSMCILYINYVV